MKISTDAIKVNPNLFLINYSATLDDVITPAKPKTNHIWIYDRSGSMYSLLDRLIEDLIIRVKKIPAGDTITFGWFSSEGQYNFIIKGFKVTDDSDYTILEKILRANNTTIGMTCFSEILDNTSQVISDLSIFSDQFALCFFTDGYPVVSNYTKEVNNIYNAIAKISNKLIIQL
jgi:hypothetical protein